MFSSPQPAAEPIQFPSHDEFSKNPEILSFN